MEQPTLTRTRVSDSRPVLPAGFKAAGVHCGIRRKGTRLDLGLIVADDAFPAAAVYTQNQLTGAHVGLCKESLAKTGGRVRALLVNSGNANCSTGEEGIEDARKIRAACAELIGCPPDEVLFLSTGVIGARLPVEKILGALPGLSASVSVNGLGDFAQAIMTTDLVPKVRTLSIEDKSAPPFRVTGIAKGSGMIHPNMATMFGFLLTDAPAPSASNTPSDAAPATGSSKVTRSKSGVATVQRTARDASSASDAGVDAAMRDALRDLAAKSFHRLTVDGDTSPNDTVILWCTGAAANATSSASRFASKTANVPAALAATTAPSNAGARSRSASSTSASAAPTSTLAASSTSAVPSELFTRALLEVSRELCRVIAADGEGATRLVTVEVRGAPSEEAAAIVGRTIATSPLTKTAVHGRDPNWGRILAAAGRSGVAFDVNRARVWIGEADVYSNGKPHPENEPVAHLHLLNNHEVILGIDLAAGTAEADAWTCDFSADYVRINADYRS
jgi:glutamate N-acetyltransferase/amino-acid N-acetyltransferase